MFLLFLVVDPPSNPKLSKAAKDARASHGAITDLFERIESFFDPLENYTRISLTTKLAEVLVNIVIELLSILSIATKEVKRRRASELFRQDMFYTPPISCSFRKSFQETTWEDRY